MNNDWNAGESLKIHDKRGGNMEVKVWSVGEDSELYAAKYEQELRAYLEETLGKEDAAEAFAAHFEEVTDLDEEREYDDDGQKKWLSYRQLIAMNGPVPTQISTSYN